MCSLLWCYHGFSGVVRQTTEVIHLPVLIFILICLACEGHKSIVWAFLIPKWPTRQEWTLMISKWRAFWVCELLGRKFPFFYHLSLSASLINYPTILSYTCYNFIFYTSTNKWIHRDDLVKEIPYFSHLFFASMPFLSRLWVRFWAD